MSWLTTTADTSDWLPEPIGEDVDMLTADLLGEDWHLPRLVQPAPVPDPAVRHRVLVDGEPQSPATVHIAPKRRAA